MHDLALVYLALTHGSDAKISDAEKEAMADKLQEWFKEDDREAIQQVMEEAGRVYMQDGSEQEVQTAISSIGKEMNKGLRIAVLDDLSDIASADGQVVEGEVSLLQHLTNTWGIEKEID